jgi:hypothetical protein
VGGLAIRTLLRRTGLSDCIGHRFVHGDAVAVPLPHPSGASAWLNDPVNRRRVEAAARLIADELAAIGARS